MTTIRKLTAAELSIEQAMTEGMTAGLMNREASTNPYQSGLPEHEEWELSRKMAVHCALAGAVC